MCSCYSYTTTPGYDSPVSIALLNLRVMHLRNMHKFLPAMTAAFQIVNESTSVMLPPSREQLSNAVENGHPAPGDEDQWASGW